VLKRSKPYEFPVKIFLDTGEIYSINVNLSTTVSKAIEILFRSDMPVVGHIENWTFLQFPIDGRPARYLKDVETPFSPTNGKSIRYFLKLKSDEIRTVRSHQEVQVLVQVALGVELTRCLVVSIHNHLPVDVIRDFASTFSLNQNLIAGWKLSPSSDLALRNPDPRNSAPLRIEILNADHDQILYEDLEALINEEMKLSPSMSILTDQIRKVSFKKRLFI
jgi:hypothetical protein